MGLQEEQVTDCLPLPPTPCVSLALPSPAAIHSSGHSEFFSLKPTKKVSVLPPGVVLLPCLGKFILHTALWASWVLPALEVQPTTKDSDFLGVNTETDVPLKLFT